MYRDDAHKGVACAFRKVTPLSAIFWLFGISTIPEFQSDGISPGPTSSAKMMRMVSFFRRFGHSTWSWTRFRDIWWRVLIPFIIAISLLTNGRIITLERTAPFYYTTVESELIIWIIGTRRSEEFISIACELGRVCKTGVDSIVPVKTRKKRPDFNLTIAAVVNWLSILIETCFSWIVDMIRLDS